jgi:hypothetical protein
MTYTHLTQAERYQIEILRKANHNQSEIAVLAARLKNNPRIGMAYRQLAKMPADELAALKAQAAATRERLNSL